MCFQKGDLKMRLKKILSGVLAGAMVLTSLYVGDMTVQAVAPTPAYTYSFENSIGDAEKVTNQDYVFVPYTGDATFDTGKSGQAVRLGEYGLKLNKKNIGSNYTVSMWVKPEGSIAENAPVLFMGYDLTQKWVAVAGDDGGQRCKVWTFGDTWKIINTVTLPSSDWSLLTITGNGANVTSYVNGEKIGTGTGAVALEGEEQDICLGVNVWDGLFSGLVDEVQIYNSTLTDADVYLLYNSDATEESVFEEKGFTVRSAFSTKVGCTTNLKITLPTGVSPESATTVFEGYDNSKVEVAADGTVTAVETGTTTITTRITVGSITKTKDTTVNVHEDFPLAVDYDMSVSGGYLEDITGNGNNALIHNSSMVTFSEEDGEKVMTFEKPASGALNDHGYVDLPLSIMDSLTDKESFTIRATYSKSSELDTTSWLYCFGSDVKLTGDGFYYLFYCPFFHWGTGEIRAGIKNGEVLGEKRFITNRVTNSDQYYTVDLVFDQGTITMFVDGVMIDEKLDSGYSIVDDVITPGCVNNILGYIGKSVWGQDAYFLGNMKAFKIYDLAMNDADIQVTYQEGFQNKFTEEFSASLILGDSTKNPTLDNVAYNLTLPLTYDELSITWTSSDENVLSNSGQVYNGTQDKTVTLTAEVSSGILTATKTFTITVKALNKTALNDLIAQAEAIDTTYYTTTTVNSLRAAINNAATAATQKAIDDAITSINRAISRLAYIDEYENPWSIIETVLPASTATIEVGKSSKLFTLPEAVNGMVDVTYVSSAPSIVEYQNGTAKALKAGTATVKVVVTAKYDNTTVEYATIVTAKAAGSDDSGISKVTATVNKTKLAKGKKAQIKVNTTAVKDKNPRIDYSISNSKVISVDTKTGKVSAKKAGTSKVTVTVTISTGEKFTKTFTFKVGAINKTSVKKGKTVTLKVNGISGNANWTIVKGKSLAKLNKKKGKSVKLTAKKKGTITVRAKVAGVTINQKIKIK